MPRAIHRRDRRIRRLLTGMAALTGLVVIVIAAPLVLWTAWRHLGPPIPSLNELASPDDGTVFVRMLCLVGWLGWATFAWSVLAEILGQWRGWRLPALDWQQRMVAGLVASIAMMLNSPAIASASATPVHAPLMQDRPAAGAALTPPATNARTAVQPTYAVHEVKRGEQLPQLAEQYYGDRFQWQRIAAANYGIAQPGGKTLNRGDTRIYPGWRLRIPMSDATLSADTSLTTPTAVAAATPTQAPVIYTVRHGDWLWFIADRFLGDPERYPEIAALNSDLITATTGIHGPNHIEGGWKLVLPADAHDRGPRAHAKGTAHVPTAQQSSSSPGDPGNLNGSPTPGPTPSATPAPSASPSPAAPTSGALTAPTAAATAGGTTASASPTASPTAPSDSGAADADQSTRIDEVGTYGGLVGATLLAALILGAVLRRRRRQQQHRRPQRRLPHPRGGTIEKTLRVAEQPFDVDRLDAGLRALAAGLASHEQAQLPDILGTWLVAGDLHIVLAEPCPYIPAGWIDDGHQWTLPAAATLPETDGNIAPLPTLVPVCSRPGRHLLLDLERIGSLSITGDPDRARDLLRSMASELACNSWSDDVEVILVGFGHDESELLVALNPDRVRAVATVSEAVSRLRRRVATAANTLRHAGARDALAGRIGDLAGDAWMPQVLLVADADGHDLAVLAPLADELAAAGRCAVATVAIGSVASPRTANLPTNAEGAVRVLLGPLDITAAAAGLPAEELEPLAEIMRQARVVADEPVPAASETESWAADTDAAGGLLGLFERKPDVEAELGNSLVETAATNTPVSAPPAQVISIAPWRTGQLPAQPAADGTTASTIPAIGLTGTRRQVTAAIRQRRRQADPHLDRDLQAWNEQDPTIVRVAVLGPVSAATPGEEPTERRRFLAEIIVFLAQRAGRGATGDKLSDALWPDGNVKDASRRVAITRARRWLGTTPDGEPWLPEMGPDRTYRLADGYLLDWHLFRRLRSRGEAHGPAGVKDLRAALQLVRGVPLDGADRAYALGARNPYTWLPESEIYPGHIVSAIVDTAHELAELYLDAGDTTNARWAVERAWLADPYRADDELWRDIMRAEHIDGHTSRLRHLLGELMQARDAEVPEDLSTGTYAWLRTIMADVLMSPL